MLRVDFWPDSVLKYHYGSYICRNPECFRVILKGSAYCQHSASLFKAGIVKLCKETKSQERRQGRCIYGWSYILVGVLAIRRNKKR